jgi:hypothetical protein
MTFRDNARLSAGPFALTPSPFSSVPRVCVPFVRFLLIWQAHAARAPTAVGGCRGNKLTEPSRRWGRPVPPSAQASDAGSTSSPCFFPCAAAFCTSRCALAGVTRRPSHAAQKVPTCGIRYLCHPGWLGPLSSRFDSLLGTPGPP